MSFGVVFVLVMVRVQYRLIMTTKMDKLPFVFISFFPFRDSSRVVGGVCHGAKKEGRKDPRRLPLPLPPFT